MLSCATGCKWTAMTADYVLGAIVLIGLLAYLIYALHIEGGSPRISVGE